jgi:hypothetical protein
MGALLGLLARVFISVIEQPGTVDVVSAVAKRLTQYATQRVVSAINKRTKLRKTEEHFS